MSQTIEVMSEIAASPEIVHRYLTESELMGQWLMAQVALDAREEGHFEVAFSSGSNRIDGEVLELSNDVLKVTWGLGEGSPDAEKIPAGSTTVEFRLTPRSEGTELKITHEGLPDDQIDDHRSGWIFYLSQLAPLAANAHFGEIVPTVIEQFTQAWNTDDGDERMSSLRSVAVPTVGYVGQYGDASTLDALDSHIAATRKFMPGHSVKRVGTPRIARAKTLSDWEILRDETNDVVVKGTDLLELSLAGKILRVTSFPR